MKLIDYMKQERYTSRHLSEAMQISIQHAYQISRAQVFASKELAERIQAWTKNKVKAQSLMRPKVCKECGRPYQKEKLIGEIVQIKKS